MKKRNVVNDYDKREDENEKSYQEIANMLGLPSPSSARYHYYKALKKIIPALTEYYEMPELSAKEEEILIKSNAFKNIIVEAFNSIDEERKKNER